jgi:hypothetical protein
MFSSRSAILVCLSVCLLGSIKDLQAEEFQEHMKDAFLLRPYLI